MRRKTSVAVLGTILALLVVAIPSTSAKPKEGSAKKEVYTGTIVFFGGRLSGQTTTFTLTLDRTASGDDFDRHLDVLKSKGQDGVLDAIRKERRGTLQIGSELGQDLNVVRVAENDEGGKTITAAFGRWMKFAELRAGSRTVDYPFTYIELVMDSKGKGEGTFIPVARLDFNKKKNAVEVENFGAFPAKLMGVRKRA